MATQLESFRRTTRTYLVTSGLAASTPLQIVDISADIGASGTRAYRIVNLGTASISFVLTPTAVNATAADADGEDVYLMAPGATEIFDGGVGMFFSCITGTAGTVAIAAGYGN